MNKSAFLALCNLASKENWCWNLACTTCGHMHFRYAFKELANGKHPDKESWIINNRTSITSEVVQTAKSFSEQDQEKLLQLVLEASLEEIRVASKFPDWLGYIGLVLRYCGGKKAQLSKAWAPQFLNMLPKMSHAHDAMIEVKNGLRSINLKDLEDVEQALFRTIY